MTQLQFETSARMLLNEYMTPIYQIIGAACAALVITLAIVMVIKPFIRRV